MIYIDLGCHNGETLEWFLSTHIAKGYGFDPSTRYEKEWQQLKKDYDIEFSHKAAWIEETTKVFNLQPEGYDLGSSLMPEKKDYNDGEKIEVETFDFSEWIKQFKGEEVYVKFNIEGAEFPIIQKMMKDGTDEIITHAWVEWHDGRKMPNYEVDKQYIWDNVKFEWEHWRGI